MRDSHATTLTKQRVFRQEENAKLARNNFDGKRVFRQAENGKLARDNFDGKRVFRQAGKTRNSLVTTLTENASSDRRKNAELACDSFDGKRVNNRGIRLNPTP